MTAHPTATTAPAMWTGLVLTEDQSFFAGRTMRQSIDYVPPGMFADPGWLLDQVAAMFDGAGTVIVPKVPGPYHVHTWEKLTYAEQLRECTRIAGTRGWSTTDTAAHNEYAWITWTHPTLATVHMGILPRIKPEKDQLISAEDSPQVQADLLARYRAAVGVPWMSTAGVTGVNLARTLYERTIRTREGEKTRQQPLWVEHLDEALSGAGDIMWSRNRIGVEMRRGLVVKFDVRMCYGAAAGMAELPTKSLAEPTGPTDFDPAAAGFWRIRLLRGYTWAHNNNIMPPIINPSRVAADGTVWLTTPLLALLYERGHRPEVLDSRTTTATARVLRQWYERLREARVMFPTADSDRLSNAIKGTVNSAVGQMGTGRGRIQRRIWQHTIIDLARANMWRKLYEACPLVGWPFRIEHDSAWYMATDLSDIKRHSEALGVGPAMGKFKVEQTWPNDEYDRERQQEKNRRYNRRRRGADNEN